MSKEKPQWEFYAESLMFQSPHPSQLPCPDFTDLINPTEQKTEDNKENIKEHNKEKKSKKKIRKNDYLND